MIEEKIHLPLACTNRWSSGWIKLSIKHPTSLGYTLWPNSPSLHPSIESPLLCATDAKIEDIIHVFKGFVVSGKRQQKGLLLIWDVTNTKENGKDKAIYGVLQRQAARWARWEAGLCKADGQWEGSPCRLLVCEDLESAQWLTHSGRVNLSGEGEIVLGGGMVILQLFKH